MHKTYLAVVYGEVSKEIKLLEDDLVLYEKERKIIQSSALWQCLRLCQFKISWDTQALRGKHCWHPIAVMGVVDMFGLKVLINRLKILPMLPKFFSPICLPKPKSLKFSKMVSL